MRRRIVVPVGLVGSRIRRPNTAWPHAPGCHCDIEHTFTCERCGKRFGWCMGTADNMPEACDFCWAEAHAKREGEAA